jgi:DNA replication protein DnaC
MDQKSMEGLLSLLNRQVHQAITTRFSLADRDPKELEDMLLTCYKAEVVKRRMQMIQDSTTEERVRKAAKWLSGKHKTGLLIYGAACGTGKTTLANAMCNLVNYLFDSVYSQDRKTVYRTSAINLVKMYSDNPEQYKRMVSQELLFVDDLGTEPVNIKIYGNEFSPVTELLYNRYDWQRWTIVTSNLSDEQLKERYGTRIDDRLREMFDRILFQGNSYRK